MSYDDGSVTNPYYQYQRRGYAETGLEEGACVWQA